MNEISIETSDNIGAYFEYRKQSTPSNDSLFDEKYFYGQDLINALEISGLKISKKSPLYLFVLLSATPGKDDSYARDNFMFTQDETPGIFWGMSKYETLLRYAVWNFMEFINVSIYLYNYTLKHNPDKQYVLLRLLVVAALNEYDKLYSSKGKNQFAYYFRKLLQQNTNIDQPIKEFNTKTSKAEFSKYTKELKVYADDLKKRGLFMQDLTISNITITYGTMKDIYSADTSEHYFIELSATAKIYILLKPYTHNRIFITNFH